jgi:hypothetical protein
MENFVVRENPTDKITSQLYNLLKDVLKLNERVTKFSLVVEKDYYPEVTQTYWIKQIPEDVQKTSVKVLTDDESECVSDSLDNV